MISIRDLDTTLLPHQKEFKVLILLCAILEAYVQRELFKYGPKTLRTVQSQKTLARKINKKTWKMVTNHRRKARKDRVDLRF